MKIRKVMAFALAVLLLIGLLTGCSSKVANDMASDRFYNSPENGGGIYDGYNEKSEVEISSSTEAGLTDRKLVKTVELTAETEELDELLNAITARVNELGGYVENQRVYNGSAYASRRSRSASLTIRIPAEKLDGFVDHVAQSSNIVSRYAYIDDVTLTYVATENRVEALEAEHDQLLELMDKAETMSELLEVQARLTDVRYELENVTSQFNLLKNQVSYGTVHLSVDEVVEYTPVEEETFWQRISGGFVDSLKQIGDGIVEFTVFVLANLPYILLIGAGITVLIILVRRSVRKRKARKNQSQS